MRWPGVTAVLAGLLAVSSAQAQDPTEAVTTTEPVTRLPVQALNTDLSILLGRAPGVFSWTFDAAGWPNGLSAWGQDPNHTQVLWNGRSVDDLLTGRPRFDMVPVSLLATADWQMDGKARLLADSLAVASPLTRIRYESAGDGLQAVRALHVQNRYLRTSDSSGVRLQTVFAYEGAGAQGEYDGSRLRRARGITLRVGLQGASWSAWIQEVASRRAVGAHAGVVPFTGAAYASIYQRLGATVEDPTARRRTIRNDLEVGATATWMRWEGRIRLARTSQTLDFDGSTLATRGWVTRWQALPSVQTHLGSGVLSIEGHLLRDAGFGGSAWTSSPDNWTQSGVAAAYRAAGDVSIRTGLVNTSDHAWWHASASGSAGWKDVRMSGHIERDARGLTLLERSGFGTGIDGISHESGIPLQERVLARAGLAMSAGIWHADLKVSHLRERDAIIHQLDASHPGLNSRILEGMRTRSLLSLTLGWRADSRRGPYARIEGVISTSSGPNGGADALLWEQSLPRRWASGRIGWKALLFQKDLDLDVYVRGHVWESMNGLRLHTPTGLLVLPEDPSSSVDGNWLVDVGAEGDVRGATLFFAYENIFSGTQAQIGNLLVPDYPLPRQRIRFGVYWPIAN